MFELDVEAEQLSRSGRQVRLQPQPFRLLCLLVTQPGKVVTRDEIRAALWTDGTFVDVDQGVNYAIRQIRDGLGEDAERPVYIQTIPRRGYKFIAPVAAVTGNELPRVESPSLELAKLMWANIFELKNKEKQREAEFLKLKRTVLIGAAVVAVLLIGVVAYLVW
jgi:DNA-binding winged helix-turn-helix (wHTH) protein